MSHIGRGYDINQTFIIEPTGDDVPVFSACTGLFTNEILSCSGNTRIFLSDGVIVFDGNLYSNDNLSANTINASTYYSGGTNIFDIIEDFNITGGSFNTISDTLTLNRHNNSQITITGFTDYYTTGTTLIGNTVYFNRNDQLSAYTLNLNSFSADTYVTGVTFNDNQLIIVRNDGVNLSTFINSFTGLTINGALTANSIVTNSISATTYYNLPLDVYVTGGTYSAGTAVFINNTGGTFNVDGFTEPYEFTGGTITGPTNFTNGLTANTFSATTYLGLPLDVYITGGTYSNGTTVFKNNTGGTFNIDGYSTGYTLTSSEITTALGYVPLSGYTDVYVTGLTYNPATYFLSIFDNSGNTFSTSLAYLATDVTITGGTYSPTTGVATFYNTTGGTFDVTGFLTGYTDTAIVSFDYNGVNQLTIIDSTGGTFTTQINNLNITGLTAGTVSATTYFNLPTGANRYITGGTYSNGTTTLTDNSGNTIVINGYYTGSTDVFVTGATYSAGTAVFTNNTGGTFSVSGFASSIGVYLPLSGGSMSGGLVANNGLTANTISQTSYIDFSTGSTNPSNLSGRVFFDNETKSLSYYDVISGNVPIAMGQQLYTRVYNATGVQIDKGRVISITGTSNGLPSAVLSTNNPSLNHPRPIGLAAQDIAINSEGLVLNNGVLSGLTLNTFSNGDTLYLSPSVAGNYVSSTDSLPFSARTNEIGYVIQTGTTTGKIYVNINNEDSNLTLTDIERNILEGNVISTGCYEFSGLTKISNTLFSIASLKGWIVDNTGDKATLPSVTNIIYSGSTGMTTPYLNTADSTYVLINSASTVVLQSTFPTPQERRQNIYLGKVVHPNRTTILNVNNTSDYDVSPMSALRDFWVPFKLINQGVVVTPNGANLNINTSAGILWGNGVGWVTNQLNPNSVSISGTSPTSFAYRTQTGGTATDVTTIDPNNYDVNGVITNIPGSGQFTTQRIYLFPTGLVRIQYGQTYYPTLPKALAGIQSETFVEYVNNRDNGILIGLLTLKDGTTDLTNTDDAVFTLVSKLGELMGGTAGVATTTLQQAYDNSSTPEIVINAILDGLSIKNGTGNPDSTTHLLEGINSSGLTTSFITADGGFSGSSISATTYYGLPIDIRVTGGTYSAGTAVYTNNTGGTFNVSGFSTYTFTGGTVSGATSFTGGLIADTISATTYYNLPYWESGSTGVYSIKTKNDSGTDATGDYAVAEGQSNLATGVASHAEGNATTASGINSHAEGYTTIASGDYSHVEGFKSTSSGVSSHAEGGETQARGDNSHAEGFQTLALKNSLGGHVEGVLTTAEGQASHAEGESTIASGITSHAEGYLTLARGDYSHTEGSGTTASGTGSHAEGIGSGVGVDGGHAEGYLTFVGGIYGHAEGYLTLALGTNSHAEGNTTTASGQRSHAEGSVTIASGIASHAEGGLTTASGDYSHAEGNTTIASGNYSHAEGNTTLASGRRSHAEGFGSTASGEISHAEGALTTASGIYSHAGGSSSIASGQTSFVHGNNSIAGGFGTIVLGDDLTGLVDNTVYVPRLNVNLLTGGTSVNNVGIDSNGFLVVGTSGGGSGGTSTYTGTTTLDFGFPNGDEGDFTTTAVTNSNITSSSSVIFRIIPSTDHNEIEDSLLEGLTIKEHTIVDGVGFEVSAYAINGTWGVYNVFYKIIN